MNDAIAPLERLLSTAQLAELSGYKPASLRNSVHLNRGIGRHARKVGGQLRWPESIVRRWLAGELE